MLSQIAHPAFDEQLAPNRKRSFVRSKKNDCTGDLAGISKTSRWNLTLDGSGYRLQVSLRESELAIERSGDWAGADYVDTNSACDQLTLPEPGDGSEVAAFDALPLCKCTDYGLFTTWQTIPVLAPEDLGLPVRELWFLAFS